MWYSNYLQLIEESPARIFVHKQRNQVSFYALLPSFLCVFAHSSLNSSFYASIPNSKFQSHIYI